MSGKSIFRNRNGGCFRERARALQGWNILSCLSRGRVVASASFLATWCPMPPETSWPTPTASCLRPEPRLKPCTSDWDLNPRARAQTRPKPTVFQLRSHTWFQDLMKLRFLMSHRRKNSVRDKVIGKKWIDLERNTLHRQSVGHLRR